MKYGWTEAGFVHVPGKDFVWMEKQHFIKENELNKGYGSNGGIGATRDAAISEVPEGDNTLSRLKLLSDAISQQQDLLDRFEARIRPLLKNVPREDFSNKTQGALAGVSELRNVVDEFICRVQSQNGQLLSLLGVIDL